VTINVKAAVANHRCGCYLSCCHATHFTATVPRQPDRQRFEGWPGLVAFPSKVESLIVEQIAVEMFDVSEIWSVVSLHDHAMHVACAQTVTYSEHATYSEVVPCAPLDEYLLVVGNQRSLVE